LKGKRKTVLLTGASVGLGLAIARELIAKTDYHLIFTSRQNSLPRFADEGIAQGERIWLRPLDVTDKEARRVLIAEIDETLGGVDILINNAGISYRSVIEHITDEERRDQMEVNYQAPMALSRLVLPTMRKKRHGHILQISSAGGLMAMPTMGAYAASKFALEAATEAMYYELRPFGVRVSLVLPGFLRSDGFEKVVLSGESQSAMVDPKNPYHLHYHHMAGFIARLMRMTPSTPKSVARKVVRTLGARWPRLRVPATWDTHVLWWIRRYVPHRLYLMVTYRLLPGIKSWGRETRD
tara:strand:+ start:138577 stop:139464 length:888 start_codon:yes stop_codon:yes gene_type:complete